MAAKVNKTVTISLKGGSTSSGKTVPGPGSVRGGGTTMASSSSKGGGGQNVGGSGFGRASGIAKRGAC